MKSQTQKIVDPQLPQLTEVMNTTFMRSFFQNHLTTSAKSALRHCRIIGMRYKPGRHCTVTYELLFTADFKSQILLTRIEHVEKLKKNRSALLARGAMWIPELQMYLWFFPHDPRLEALAELTDFEKVQIIMANLSMDEMADEKGCDRLEIVPISYVPVRHCALKITRNNHRVFAKIYADNRGQRVYNIMQKFWQYQKSRRVRFGVTRPLAFDEKRKVLWQQWVAGQTWMQFTRMEGLKRACVLTAIALADFHQTHLSGLPCYRPEELFHKLNERTKLLIRFNPDLQKPLAVILSDLRGSDSLWQPFLQVPIHGDFNYSQILFANSHPIFIDFDAAGMGDPLYDVAHFLTSLHWLETRRILTSRQVKLASRIFIDTYQKHVPWEITNQALAKQMAMALVCRRAYKAMRQLEDNTSGKIEYYLNLAEQYLQV
ncbi:MAG: aminoglycoside phosphotransferase family protein [Calditrichaeota bacterium]|nr:MAG: aminoglycoside phosphotransferase family protein [Calditrichota bacterium]